MPTRLPLLLNNLVVSSTEGTTLSDVYAGATALNFSAQDAAGADAKLGNGDDREIPVIFYYAPTDLNYDVDSDNALTAEELAARKAQLTTVLHGVIYAYNNEIYKVDIADGQTGNPPAGLPSDAGQKQDFPARLLKSGGAAPYGAGAGGAANGNSDQADFAQLTMVSAALLDRHIALLRGSVERDLTPSEDANAANKNGFSLGGAAAFFRNVWTLMATLGGDSVLTGWKGEGNGGVFEMPPAVAGEIIAVGTNRKRLAALGENAGLPPLIVGRGDDITIPAKAMATGDLKIGDIISLSLTSADDRYVFSRSWRILNALFNLQPALVVEPTASGVSSVAGTWGRDNTPFINARVFKISATSYILKFSNEGVTPSRTDILSGAAANLLAAGNEEEVVRGGSMSAEVAVFGGAFLGDAKVRALTIGEYAVGRVIAGADLPNAPVQLRLDAGDSPDGAKHNAENGFRKGDIVAVGRVLWECTAAEEDEDGEWRRITPNMESVALPYGPDMSAGEKELDGDETFDNFEFIVAYGGAHAAEGGASGPAETATLPMAVWRAGAQLSASSQSGRETVTGWRLSYLNSTTFSVALNARSAAPTLYGYGRIADPPADPA